MLKCKARLILGPMQMKLRASGLTVSFLSNALLVRVFSVFGPKGITLFLILGAVVPEVPGEEDAVGVYISLI